MAVSIADVASRANVSISTVSRVVNGHNVVNAETRKRVEKAIRDLGYRPNVFARGLMLNKSNVLALVLPDLHGEFYSDVIRGANLKAREYGYQLLVSSLAKEGPESCVHSVVRGNALADGMALMISDMSSDVDEIRSQVNVPFVVLNSHPQVSSCDSVIVDHRHGSVEMMNHLMSSQGIRRVIFVGGPATNLDSKVRFEVYVNTLKKHGIEVSEDDVFHLDFQYETAYELAKERIDAWIGPGNCVFAGNDETAAGIIHVAQENGVCVPDDLRVVGFDDTRLAQLMKPRLTTVRVPRAEMGAVAVDLLYQRLTNPSQAPQAVTLRTELVVRESCGIVPPMPR